MIPKDVLDRYNAAQVRIKRARGELAEAEKALTAVTREIARSRGGVEDDDSWS